MELFGNGKPIWEQRSIGHVFAQLGKRARRRQQRHDRYNANAAIGNRQHIEQNRFNPKRNSDQRRWETQIMGVIELKKHAPSGTIILNRPDRRNALTRQMLRELQQAFFDFHQEKSVRSVILTGAGAAFCAGMDLTEMRETAALPNSLAQWHEDAMLYHDLIETMLRFPKPIIAAVNGPAIAGGAGLLLASDLVIGTPDAKFGLPEPRRGIVAGMVSPLLAFRIGAGHAARLLLTAESIDAAEAFRIGLYHETVGTDLVWARAHELARVCALSAPEALQLTKRLLNETIGEHLLTLLSAGAAASATARTTEAAAEGLAAFLEKREPKWS